jgi:ATP-dependent helicase/nuclease subunit A
MSTGPPEPPDHEQRKLIVDRLDATMLVEAAAGTGKTRSMTDRMVALLAGGKCRIETLVAVTFTRKAAAELQNRFQLALEDAARHASGTPAERLHHARNHVELCFIGTVHSFCARLLRERPVEAGVDPSFEELDEERDARLREQAWETFGNELFAADDPVLDELEELGLTLAELREAFLQFADYPDVDEWPAPAVPAPGLKPAVRALREYTAHMARALPTLPAEGGTDELIGLFRRVLRMTRARDLERHADVAEVFEQFKPDRKCTQKNWPGGKEQALREHERWDRFATEVAGPFVAAWRAHRYPTVLRVLERARAVYDRQRQAAHGLNFQDLLMCAAALLRDRPEIRRYFRRRFTHVLVDEFQDTDPVQAEVLLLLTADDPGERDWRKCRPVPGVLFVVGDPMQSIYRFRRADIMTYSTVKEIITSTGGSCVTLTTNFRSAAPVVDWVNATFQLGNFFPAAPNDFSPLYTPFLVGRTGHDGVPSPGIFKIAPPNTLTNQDDIAAHEADLVARHIRHALDTEPARAPGDFLIITRTKKRLSVYAAALQRLGIPHEVTGGSSLNEVRELSLLNAVLRAALEPDNPVAVVAALRSELFGFSDQELYAFRRACGRFDFRCTVPEAPGAELWRDAFACLSRYADWLANLAPIIAIERIAADLDLVPLAAAAPGGDVQAGSLGKAIELLRDAQADLPTAADFVAQLGRLIEQAEQYDGAPATAPTLSVMRVMNLHKVKGLQAPVVFLADPSGASEHAITLHVDRGQDRVTGYLALYGERNIWGRASLLAHPPDWESLAAREQQFQDAETNRLLYVAATRAGSQLIVSLRDKRTEANLWQPFASRLTDAPLLADPGPQQPPRVETDTVTQADVAAALDQIRGRWQTVLAPTYTARTAKQISFPNAPVATRDEASGVRWGGVIHSLLQAAMNAPKTDWQALATALLQAADLDVTLVEEAVETVRHVMKSTLWQRASRSRQRSTELPFVVLDAADGALVRGVIDLAFEESDGWVIVDYKTDRATGKQLEKLVETYRPQVTAYSTAWAQILQQPVKEVGLYFTNANRYVAVTP